MSFRLLPPTRINVLGLWFLTTRLGGSIRDFGLGHLPLERRLKWNQMWQTLDKCLSCVFHLREQWSCAVERGLVEERGYKQHISLISGAANTSIVLIIRFSSIRPVLVKHCFHSADEPPICFNYCAACAGCCHLPTPFPQLQVL
jgi:hypothetical protein